MPLPTLEKTPQFISGGTSSLNRYIPSQATQGEGSRLLVLGIKNCLKGFSSSPWEVVRSSNGTTVGGVGVDLWQSVGDLNWHNTTGSWIILHQPGLGMQLLLHLGTGTTYYLRATMSFAGFTGGTASARPTAVDEVHLRNIDQILPSSVIPYVYHTIQSTDGQYTHVIICSSGYAIGWWSFCKVASPVTAAVAGSPGWPNPVVASVYGSGGMSSSALTHGVYWASANFYGYANGGSMALYLTEEGYNGKGITDILSAQANELSGEWPMPPVGVASPTVGKRGRHGRLVDLWWGGILHLEGSTYPLDGSRQFAQFGHLVFPWDGSVPRTV